MIERQTRQDNVFPAIVAKLRLMKEVAEIAIGGHNLKTQALSEMLGETLALTVQP